MFIICCQRCSKTPRRTAVGVFDVTHSQAARWWGNVGKRQNCRIHITVLPQWGVLQRLQPLFRSQDLWFVLPQEKYSNSWLIKSRCGHCGHMAALFITTLIPQQHFSYWQVTETAIFMYTDRIYWPLQCIKNTLIGTKDSFREHTQGLLCDNREEDQCMKVILYFLKPFWYIHCLIICLTFYSKGKLKSIDW